MLGTSGQVFRQRWQVHKYTHTHTHTHTHSLTHTCSAGWRSRAPLAPPAFFFFHFSQKSLRSPGGLFIHSKYICRPIGRPSTWPQTFQNFALAGCTKLPKKKIEFLEFFFIFALAGGERLQKKDFLENSFLLILRCQVAQDTKKGFICIYIYIYNIYIYIARAGGAGCAQQIRGVRAR